MVAKTRKDVPSVDANCVGDSRDRRTTLRELSRLSRRGEIAGNKNRGHAFIPCLRNQVVAHRHRTIHMESG
ncbi:MAG: hypothetical protein A49_24540 [Methyloceanibacter sp.]|nr:MAG: hypothetical protein A49_24540 [Methyloceanibacter sp.]